MKKFLSVAFIVFLGLMIFPNLSNAASLSDLRAQIAELSRQVAKLQKAEVVSSLPQTVVNNPIINVVSPNGGERLEVGKSYEIKFSVSNNLTKGSVNIYLINNSTGIVQLLKTYDSVVSGDKSVNTWLWTIPNDFKIGDKYSIKVNFYATISTTIRIIRIFKATDTSDATFSIVASTPIPPTPAITIIAPNDGIDLIKGRTTQVVWKNGNLEDEIQLINTANLPTVGTTGYSYYEIKSRVNTSAFVSGEANYFNWTVGDIDCPQCVTRIGGIPEGKYIIRVIKFPSKDYDDTNLPFSIVSEPTIPNLYFLASSVSIGPDSFKVQICNSGGILPPLTAVSVVATANNVRYPASGFAFMSSDQVPYNSGSCGIVNFRYSLFGMMAGNSYNVNINVDALEAITESNEGDNTMNFQLAVPASVQPSITVLSPNGGEKLRYGGQATINWTTNNILPSAFVSIIARNYYNDGSGVTDYMLDSSTPNDGTEVVNLRTLLSGQLPVGVYKIQIKSNVIGVIVEDWSDDYLVVLPNRFIEL